MGCSSACKSFSRFTDAIIFILRSKYNITKVVKYLDDFLFVGKTKQDCLHALACFTELCSLIGVPIAHDKTEGPSKSLTFLGYHIDTQRMVLSIPKEKIVDYSLLIHETLEKDYLTLRELRSLIGKLVFVTGVINIGRCFLRRLINLKIGKTHPACRIPINAEAKDDLKLWLEFLDSFNGKSLLFR